MSDPALRVENATRTYHIKNGFRTTRALHALRGIDLEVPRGGTLGIVGESGCGKSTLAKIILGIETPSSGTVTVGGRPISSYSRLERARLIQVVFQDPYSSLNPMMRVAKIIAAPLSVQGVDRATIARKVGTIAEQVGLSAHHLQAYPSQLSGGQRQRVAIARALVGSPEIVICDEPTSALDVSVQSQILNLIKRLRRELGFTLVIISHNLAVVNYIADEVVVMHLGQIVERGRSEDVFARPTHDYTRTLLRSVLEPHAVSALPAGDAAAAVGATAPLVTAETR